MLASLSIKNYAIIRKLEVQFDPGLCVITGETGAGKSIILGAMGLILGQRADTSVLNNQKGKCVVEGRFALNDTIAGQLDSFFDANDLDFENPVILRREITPSGKSRAFINDTPVQLTLMRALGLNLFDIHSQHSNLELGKRHFQLNVVDWYSENSSLLERYTTVYKKYRALLKQRDELAAIAGQSKADFDYFQFQFKQIDELQLKESEQEELENEAEMLSHSEEIKTGLGHVYQLLDGGEFDVLSQLKDAIAQMQKLSSYFSEADSLLSRLNSQYIELQDVAGECERMAETTEHDPNRLEALTERLNLIYSLQQKHRVETVAELLALRDSFDQKIQAAESYDEQLLAVEKEIEQTRHQVAKVADELHEVRIKNVPAISNEIHQYLTQLGMPNARLKIEIRKKDDFGTNGCDDVFILFSANKGVEPEEIHKVASGGELSRLMLAIKTVVAKSKSLPAIIFDEIDTGISGEIAAKMGKILFDMSKYMQVLNITHLPQIASRGTSHYKVYKQETTVGVETDICKLTDNERVEEIAKMLGGDPPQQAAIVNAKELLGI
ncbi:MAG: DNA repair protein RecN [Prolixibacteraceae bacterium]|nr:DNA repair protein RecN [Prolixibacteraceae bacterium]MBN2649154.1 DNA repair protein RecN [Prolixibacteraceae bacterium]